MGISDERRKLLLRTEEALFAEDVVRVDLGDGRIDDVSITPLLRRIIGKRDDVPFTTLPIPPPPSARVKANKGRGRKSTKSKLNKHRRETGVEVPVLSPRHMGLLSGRVWKVFQAVYWEGIVIDVVAEDEVRAISDETEAWVEVRYDVSWL